MSPSPDNGVGGLLLSFMDALRADMQAELPDTCSFMHVKALDFIAKAGKPSMSDIAGFLKITSPGATLVVDRLVENKELDRLADADDRRVVRLAITAKGKATLKSGMKIVKERIASRLGSLGKAEQRQLAVILDKLIRSGSRISI